VVVAVGFTLIEPLAEVELNPPGAIAILVAPLVSQLSVLPAPEFMLVGLAVKEEIAGTETGPENKFDGIGEMQPANPIQADKISAIAQGASPETRNPRVLSPFLQTEPAESMRSPFVVIGDIILATPSSSRSVLQKPHRSLGMTLVIMKILGIQTALRFFLEIP